MRALSTASRDHSHRPLMALSLAGLLLGILASGCTPSDDPPSTTPTAPAITLADLDVTSGQTIYVPAYSEIIVSRDLTLDLAVNLTIHNTDISHPIIISSVRYYDSDGQFVREYLTEPRHMGPLATTDFFVDAKEESGGLGTNFIVEWVAEQPVFEPIVEAIMINTVNHLGISLTSPGRVISQIEATED